MSSWRALQAAPWNTRLPLAERTRGSWRHDVYSLLQQRGHAGMGSDGLPFGCLLYTSPSPRDRQKSRMPSSA